MKKIEKALVGYSILDNRIEYLVSEQSETIIVPEDILITKATIDERGYADTNSIPYTLRLNVAKDYIRDKVKCSILSHLKEKYCSMDTFRDEDRPGRAKLRIKYSEEEMESFKIPAIFGGNPPEPRQFYDLLEDILVDQKITNFVRVKGLLFLNKDRIAYTDHENSDMSPLESSSLLSQFSGTSMKVPLRVYFSDCKVYMPITLLPTELVRFKDTLKLKPGSIAKVVNWVRNKVKDDIDNLKNEVQRQEQLLKDVDRMYDEWLSPEEKLALEVE